MNTEIELEVRVTLSLSNRADRDLTETKIDTLIGNQAAGSYSINEFKENQNAQHQYWFFAQMFIEGVTFANLVDIRNTIVTGLENNFTEQQIVDYEFDPVERKI